MDENRLKLWVGVLLGLLAAALVTITVLLWPGIGGFFGLRGDPETIASSSLEGLREQNVLVPFTARVVGIVTSSESRFGGVLSAKKTLILPGTVRYELDLGELEQDDVTWNPDTRTMQVTLPDIRIVGPEVDLTQMREYRDGEFLLAIGDTEDRLDTSNRDAAVAQMLTQAQADSLVRMAREAARKAVTSNLEIPLNAAGIEDARIEAKFAYEGTGRGSQLDRSRTPKQVLREKREREAAGN